MKIIHIVAIAISILPLTAFSSMIDISQEKQQAIIVNACRGKAVGDKVSIWIGENKIQATCTIAALPKAEPTKKRENLWD